MEVAQLNARIDAQLKREGDATLARFGVSATDAIRALWGTLAKSGTLPDFLQDQGAGKGAETTEVAVPASVVDGAGMAMTLAQQRGLACSPDDLSYEELRDLAFEELVAEGVHRV